MKDQTEGPPDPTSAENVLAYVHGRYRRRKRAQLAISAATLGLVAAVFGLTVLNDGGANRVTVAASTPTEVSSTIRPRTTTTQKNVSSTDTTVTTTTRSSPTSAVAPRTDTTLSTAPTTASTTARSTGPTDTAGSTSPRFTTTTTPSHKAYTEQEATKGVNTFTDHHGATGMGPRINPEEYVEVSCKVYDPSIASVSPDGYWYRIASAPWSNAYYAPANTFWNGDVLGQTPYTHNTDFKVPNC